jgi:hypothetical protein
MVLSFVLWLTFRATRETSATIDTTAVCKTVEPLLFGFGGVAAKTKETHGSMRL